MPDITPAFAAAYVRVSTDEQAELSPESQLAEIRKYAERQGHILLDDQIYIDEGISGKKAQNRPCFQQMIAAAKGKEPPFSVILVWKFSRFARNQEESIFYKSILRSKCGVEVVSVTEPLIAGPFGSLIERIIEWMDEFYSIRLSQEVKRSMVVNANNGKLQATPSFGYGVEDGVLVPNEEEAAYVRRIFDDFLSGRGAYQIAKDLNALGVRTHRGNKFENRTVEYIIRNPVYIGKLRWNPEGRTRRDFTNANIITAQSTHQPLISDETWNAAQQRMDEVKLQWGYKARPTFELKGWTSGIVRCAACGTTLVFAAPKYYKCNGFVKGRCTHSQHIAAALLEQAIIDRLEADATGSGDISYEVLFTSASGGAELSHQKAALRQIDTKRERLKDAYLAGVIALDEYARSRAELDDAAAKLQQTIDEIQGRTEPAKTAALLRSAITEALKTLKAPDATKEQKNEAARSVIENCTFDKAANTLAITYRFIF